MTIRLVVTPGEPAGIGPDIVLHALQQPWPVELVVVADPKLMEIRASLLNIPADIEIIDCNHPPAAHQPGQLKIYPQWLSNHCMPGHLDVRNAGYVLNTLKAATSLCLNQQATALVTGPVQKSILNAAGYPFQGHTEYLAELTGAPQTLMLFVTDHMRVALATTHLPLSTVPSAITSDLLRRTLHLLASELQKTFKIKQPRLLVAGLNPHAGEGGYLGTEEITIIQPVIHELKQVGLSVEGPYSADTLFTPDQLSKADAILAMYHDQALPVIKYAGFHHAVNVTLGLPFIRTSVDHGTALTLAGSGKANSQSLCSALALAADLTRLSA